MKDAKEFMQRIKKSGRPKYVQTDALQLYPRAFRKSFYSNFKNRKVEHRINNVSKTGKHNVRIETVFMKIKDRVHDFRGLKALWSAPILMQGIILQHNFIEEHTTTGQIPSELAGIKTNTGINRWLGLIKQSAKI
jgi:transposase-like protein